MKSSTVLLLTLLASSFSLAGPKPDATGWITRIEPGIVRVQGPMKKDVFFLDLSRAQIEIDGRKGNVRNLRVRQTVEIFFARPPKARVGNFGWDVKVRLLRATSKV